MCPERFSTSAQDKDNKSRFPACDRFSELHLVNVPKLVFNATQLLAPVLIMIPLWELSTKHYTAVRAKRPS